MPLILNLLFQYYLQYIRFHLYSSFAHAHTLQTDARTCTQTEPVLLALHVNKQSRSTGCTNYTRIPERTKVVNFQSCASANYQVVFNKIGFHP